MFVEFISAKDGGVMARVDGKVSFPERFGEQPKVGEVWEVEAHEKQRINILRCVRRMFAAGEWVSFANAGPKGVKINEHFDKWSGSVIETWAYPKEGPSEKQYQIARQYLEDHDAAATTLAPGDESKGENAWVVFHFGEKLYAVDRHGVVLRKNWNGWIRA